MLNQSNPQCVLLFEGTPITGELATEASRNRWPLIRIRSAGDALRHLCRHATRCVIVPLSRDDFAAVVELVGEVRRRRPDVVLVAVASTHDADTERSVRAAGVSRYLELVRGGESLRAAVESLSSTPATPTPATVSARAGPSPPKARAPTAALAPVKSRHERDLGLPDARRT